MLTTDTLLLKIVNDPSFSYDSDLSSRERNILLSMSTQLKRSLFLTKKQSNLLISILQANKEKIKNVTVDDLELIDNPIWSQEFREVQTVKKIYFSDEKFSNIILEISYDKSIRDKINKLKNEIIGNVDNISPSIYKINSNEFNLITVVDCFLNDEFNLSNDIKDLYEKIKNLTNNNSNYLNIFSPNNQQILNLVLDEVDNEQNKDLILLDRKIKYQYSIVPKNTSNSLDFKIANRSKPYVWIDSNLYNLESVFDSLVTLNKFPCLLIFDKHNISHSLKMLKMTYDYIKKHNIDNVGIYFRVDNSSDSNKEFNSFIKDNNLNNRLSDNIKIAGITKNSLPKFFFNSNWYPESVISFTDNINGFKTGTFCCKADLVIHYNSAKPLHEKLYDLL
jgi:hypothetical protein